MPHSSVAVANWLLSRPGALDRLTQMQLQKLVYIAHGWNLAINDAPLTKANEPIEAWDYGPVYRRLYRKTKLFGAKPLGRLIRSNDDQVYEFFNGLPDDGETEMAEPDRNEAAVLGKVWDSYGDLPAVQLSALTHRPGTPWSEVYAREPRDGVIPDELIKQHYSKLAAQRLRQTV